MKIQEFRNLLDQFEQRYPDEFAEERTAFMNQLHARILKVGEIYHADVIIERKFGAMRVSAETKYAENRVREEAKAITEEEVCQFAARLILKLKIREVEL